MNAYELADLVDERYAWLETKTLSSMLRQQADRIAELEKQNQTLKVGIGVLKGISKMAEDYEKRTTPQTKPLSDEEIMDELVKVKHTWVATTKVWFEFEKEELLKAIRAIEAKVRGQ